MSAREPSSETTKPPRAARRRARFRVDRRIAWVLLGLAVVGLIVLAAWPRPIAVETALVRRGTLVVTVDEDGRARVKDRYVVSAPIAGHVARIELDPGDSVTEGAVLAHIVPLASPLLDERSRRAAEARVASADAARRQAKAQIERARAAVDYARRESARNEALQARGTIPESELERGRLAERTAEAELASAEFAARVADYELETARAAIGRQQPGVQRKGGDRIEVSSPVAATVLRVVQESEGAVQAGAELIELGDPRALEVVVDLLTSDVVEVRPGARVQLERWGGPPLEGRVRLVEPSAFTRISSLGVEEQRVNTIVELTSPYERWAQLGDGYRVEARIEVWRGADVLFVPASAVFRDGDGWAVFAVVSGVIERRAVELGRRTPESVEIRSGLEEGGRVVTHPSDRVKTGVKVGALRGEGSSGVTVTMSRGVVRCASHA